MSAGQIPGRILVLLVVAVFFAAATHTAVWATEPKAAPYDLDDSGDRRRDGDPSWRRLGVVGDFVPLTTVEEENRFGSAGGSSAPGSAAKAAMLAASANVPAWRVGDKLIYNDGTWEQLVAIGSDTLRFVNQDGMVFPRGPDFILPARRFQALAAIFPGLDQFVANENEAREIRQQWQDSLTATPRGETDLWLAADGSRSVSMTPGPAFPRPDGSLCRRYSQRLQASGLDRVYPGIACENPAGAWQTPRREPKGG